MRLIIGMALAISVFAPRNIEAGFAASFSKSDYASASLGSMDENVFDLALGAASCAVKSGAVEGPRTLTIIDYSRPSTEKRLWVIDLTTRELLYEELVAHGQGTGANIASKFSNNLDSHQTSLGLFVTDTT